MIQMLRRNMTIPEVKLLLTTERQLNFENTVGLRGFVGRQFTDNVLLHNHNDGDLIYSYPRVQYKIIDFKASIIGMAEGVGTVKNIPRLEKITLGSEDVKVNSVTLSEHQSTFGILTSSQAYSFLTPWLALNEKNYDQYRKLRTWPEKKQLLEKILIGNIISMSKSLGYTVPEPIKGTIAKMEEIPTTLKGTPMLGFLGSFSVNFEIPDYWGIGKSVSRGFGTIKRQTTELR